MMRRGSSVALVCAAMVLTLATPTAGAAPGDATLERYARDTWASFVAMTDKRSGLPADVLEQNGKRSVQTSTTNIGAYMWSGVAAERLGIIGHAELVSRLRTTMTTLEHMERHSPDGQFYNWYDHRDGSKLTYWPPTGAALDPILSSVDNAWLATGLRIVRNRVPELASRAGAIYDSMDFGFYYVPASNRILFHYSPAQGTGPCCYDTVVSESRIADYVGISKGELPTKEYYGRWRSFPDSCDWSWQETRPAGFNRSYEDVPVYEGSYPYGSTRLTPSWGGSMFEALMPALFVPEERWAPGSWRMNHPVTVDAQIDHGLNAAGYGMWGFSPSNIPEGGYSGYGVDAAGMDPNGMASNEDGTLVDRGYPGCGADVRPPQPDPPQSAYTNGVVTPHAAFLALRYRRDAALTDLAAMERVPGAYNKWGFADSINVDTPFASRARLSLDQGMIMAAIGNALGGDVLRNAFSGGEVAAKVRPVLGVEEFNVQPRGCTITGTAGADRLTGTSGDDVICGLGGNDTINGGGGDDAIYGDAGADRIDGGAGADTLYGDDGDDRLDGGDGDDVLAGGPGADRLSGGKGVNHLEEGGG
jgi:hypothetical protein